MLDPAILARILEEPDNDTHRLIAADWLDENGEGERAEFVRVQVELANGQQKCNCVERLPSTVGCSECKRFARLRRRERKLLPAAYFPTFALGECAQWKRGFVHNIRCQAAEWQRITIHRNNWPFQIRTDQPVTLGQQILRQHPVERVEFTDCGITIKISIDCGVPLPWCLEIVNGQCHSYPDRAALIDAMPQQLRAWGVGDMPDIQRLPPGRILTARRVVRDIRQTPIPLDVSTRIS